MYVLTFLGKLFGRIIKNSQDYNLADKYHQYDEHNKMAADRGQRVASHNLSLFVPVHL